MERGGLESIKSHGSHVEKRRGFERGKEYKCFKTEMERL